MAAEWLTIEEAAEHLKVNKIRIKILADRAMIPASKVGSRWRFNKERVDNWFSNEEHKKFLMLKRLPMRRLRIEDNTEVNSLLTTPEAMKYLEVTRITIYKLMKRGQLPVHKVGYHYRYRKEELDKLLNSKWYPYIQSIKKRSVIHEQ